MPCFRSLIACYLTFTCVPRAEEEPSSKVAKVEVPMIRPPIMPNNMLGMGFPPRPYGVPRPMYALFSFYLHFKSYIQLIKIGALSIGCAIIPCALLLEHFLISVTFFTGIIPQ